MNFGIDEVNERLNEIMNIFDNINNSVAEMSILCTLFDLICEKHNMDKNKILEMIYDVNQTVRDTDLKNGSRIILI